VAIAVSAGIVLDRYVSIPLAFSLLAAFAALVSWAIASLGRRSTLPLIYLWLSIAALGAAYHHLHRDTYPADDIGYYATAEPRLIHLRGVLEEEPSVVIRPRHDPLQSYPHPDEGLALLRATHLEHQETWLPVSGLTQLVVEGPMLGLHVGDEVEIIGRLQATSVPANPGERDHASLLRDRRIRAVVTVHKTSDGVTRLAEGWPRTLTGWLARLRAWGERTLRQALPDPFGDVSTALLLGEESALSSQVWEKYIRNGVVHVLVISGQQLVVLAYFLWLVVRVMGVGRRRGAWFIMFVLLAYATLTGGRPPALRAAVMVCMACGGLLLRRPVLSTNSLALAWLVVGLLNPTNYFNSGCQLSFLALALIHWLPVRWFRPPTDPLDRLIEESRPAGLRWLHVLGRRIGRAYALTFILWLASAPLVASHYHLLSPIGLVLAPLLILLTSLALICGFLLLLAAPVCWPLAQFLAWPTRWLLASSAWIVDTTDGLPGSHWYVGDVPEWWLWVFYLTLFSLLLIGPLRRRWRWTIPAGAAWLCVGLLSGSARPAGDELRCTFLAVGHGGCTVLEMPDGRTLLYDAGSLNGPDVTKRQIAPFLWSRGIHRVDEVLLSHADLDHFNGLPALLERFSVGQVTCTPTFSRKGTPGVAEALDALAQHHIPIRIVSAGDRLAAGEVEIEVLHPAADSRGKDENARSMVLLVRHVGHTLLLTGDLDGQGLTRVLTLPSVPVDILMAPHHGSHLANRQELAAWARPQVAIACQGPPLGGAPVVEPYTAGGARFLGTWPHGAITVHSHPSGLVIETYQSGERFVVHARPGR
jgi:competence protein ComEC